jgi:hypothetical protein
MGTAEKTLDWIGQAPFSFSGSAMTKASPDAVFCRPGRPRTLARVVPSYHENGDIGRTARGGGYPALDQYSGR